jgi:hypothetical protein
MKSRAIQIAAAIAFILLVIGNPSHGQEPEASVDSISSRHVGIINPFARPINIWIDGVKYSAELADGMMEYECSDPCYVTFNPKLGSYKIDLSNGYEITWDKTAKRLYPKKVR